jgi:Ca2+/Na+ antiporter
LRQIFDSINRKNSREVFYLLTTFIIRYKISERLAGSTILALGGSVGLYASNMNAVLLNKSDEIQLGLTGILGSALFQMAIAVGLGCLVIKSNYKLSYFLITRDLIIYLVVVVILFNYLEMNMITAAQVIF